MPQCLTEMMGMDGMGYDGMGYGGMKGGWNDWGWDGGWVWDSAAVVAHRHFEDL